MSSNVPLVVAARARTDPRASTRPARVFASRDRVLSRASSSSTSDDVENHHFLSLAFSFPSDDVDVAAPTRRRIYIGRTTPVKTSAPSDASVNAKRPVRLARTAWTHA